MSERKLMNPNQAGAYVGVAAQTLARWRIEGAGPVFLKLGSRVRYDVADLDRWIDARRRSSTSTGAPPSVAA